MSSSFGGVYDIIGEEVPTKDVILTGYSSLLDRTKNLCERTKYYESHHQMMDFKNLSDMVSSLKLFISNYLARSFASLESYQAGSVMTQVRGVNIAETFQKANDSQKQRIDLIIAANANESARFEILKQENIEQRVINGFFKVLRGGAVAGYLIFVIAGGPLTPFAITIAVGVLGTPAVVGSSEIYEGTQDIYYSLIGDFEGVSFNPIRDTIFAGDPESYEAFREYNYIIAAISSPFFRGFNTAFSVTEGAPTAAQVTKSILFELGKDGAMLGSVYLSTEFGDYVAEKTGSELLGKVVTVATALISIFGINSFANFLNVKYNLDGLQNLNPNVVDDVIVINDNLVDDFIPEKVVLENGDIAFKSSKGELVRSADYLDDVGDIKWPIADGFVVDENGNAIMSNANMKKGQIIDRYGDSGGKFTSPLENGVPADYNTRGLPYPESSKSYYKYEVIQDINMENVQNAYNNMSPL